MADRSKRLTRIPSPTPKETKTFSLPKINTKSGTGRYSKIQENLDDTLKITTAKEIQEKPTTKQKVKNEIEITDTPMSQREYSPRAKDLAG